MIKSGEKKNFKRWRHEKTWPPASLSSFRISSLPSAGVEARASESLEEVGEIHRRVGARIHLRRDTPKDLQRISKGFLSQHVLYVFFFFITCALYFSLLFLSFFAMKCLSKPLNLFFGAFASAMAPSTRSWAQRQGRPSAVNTRPAWAPQLPLSCHFDPFMVPLNRASHPNESQTDCKVI